MEVMSMVVSEGMELLLTFAVLAVVLLFMYLVERWTGDAGRT